MDTTKPSNVILARSGEGQNLVRKGEVLLEDKAKVASGLGGQHTSVNWHLVLSASAAHSLVSCQCLAFQPL